MHQHQQQAFSRQALVKNTIVTLDPKYQRLLGANKRGLSFRDKAIINRLYKCERLCSNSDSCLNNGFLKVPPKDRRSQSESGNVCACECPPNASGPNCEQLSPLNYYDTIEPLPCGGNVTSPCMIETPGYPSRTAPKQSCVWNIQVLCHLFSCLHPRAAASAQLRVCFAEENSGACLLRGKSLRGFAWKKAVADGDVCSTHGESCCCCSRRHQSTRRGQEGMEGEASTKKWSRKRSMRMG